MNNKIIFSILGIALLVGGGYKLFSNKTQINEAATYVEKNENIAVVADEVRNQKINAEFTYIGTFQAVREVQFGSETQGKVMSVLAKEGDNLRQGQLLGKVDNEALNIQLEAQQVALETQKAGIPTSEMAAQTAQAAADKAARDLQRFENLSKDNAVSDMNLQNTKIGANQAETAAKQAGMGIKQANLGVKSTEAQIKGLEKQLRSTNITAPIGGYLTMRNFEVGSVIGMGTPLGMITDISAVKLAINVPESDLQKFQIGQTINIKVDAYTDKTFSGKVSLVSVKGDPSHNFKVEITVPNNDAKHQIRAGMYGRAVGKEVTASEHLVVARQAVIGADAAGNSQMYVVENGRAVLRSVQLGTSYGDLTAVKSGLKAGDKVVVKGQVGLENGITVKVTSAEAGL